MAMMPPKGRILLPGRTNASRSMIGAKTFAAAHTSARPAINGQSNPTFKRRPLSLPFAKFVIPCERGSTAAMNQEPIRENNSRQNAAVNANVKIAFGVWCESNPINMPK